MKPAAGRKGLQVCHAGRHALLSHAELRRSRGVVAALAVADGVVLADLRHPAFDRPDARTAVARADVESVVRSLGFPDDAIDNAWQVDGEQPHVHWVRHPGPLDVVPPSAAWAAPARVDQVQLALTVGDRVLRVVHHRAPGAPLAPAAAAWELVGLLLTFARGMPLAAQVLDVLLRDQPLLRLAGDEGTVVTPLVGPALDVGDTFVWDRSRAGGPVLALAADAEELRSARRPGWNGGAELVPVGAALTGLVGHAADPGTPPGAGTWLRGDDPTAWLPSGWALERSTDQWRAVPRGQVAFDPPRAVALLDADGCVRLHPFAGATEDEAVAALGRVVTAARRPPPAPAHPAGQQVAPEPPPEVWGPMRVRWPGIDAAVAATRDRALGWLGTRGAVPDRVAVDSVISVLLRPTTPDSRLGLVEAALARVGVEDIEGRRYGTQAVATAVLEREVELRSASRPADGDVFADALTAYLSAVARTNLWPPVSVRWRVVHSVHEWLTGERTGGRQDRVGRAVLAAHGQDWQALCERAPWLQWYGQGVPERPLDVDVPTLVEFLALLRPRLRVSRNGSMAGQRDRLESADLPPHWHQIFSCAAGPDVTKDHLASLARLVEPLLYEPADTARALQSYELPTEITEALQARVAADLRERAGLDHLLVVHDPGGAQPRVVLVNRGRYPAVAQLDDVEVRLSPFAIEDPGAHRYASPPLTIHGARPRLAVGERSTELELTDDGLDSRGALLDHQVPPDLFRGREEQLAQLRAQLEGSGPRTGSLVSGTRRAGKSTLAFQICRESERGHLWLDLADTPTSVRDAAAWQVSVATAFREKVRRQLGVALREDVDDLVRLVAELDEALAGGPPVPVVLDELDVLLLPEQGDFGRRLANRLGAMSTDNIALIGTVQRFHREVHEFKTWQSVECPADLSWTDGVTYFCPPLTVAEDGLAVRSLRRAAVAPDLYDQMVVPTVGLRPYFWGRLLNELEADLRKRVRPLPGVPSTPRPRLLGRLDLDRHLDRLATNEIHLNTVLDQGEHLDAAEQRRRDLFSGDERRVLLALAARSKDTLPRAIAVRIGGDAALQELLDRSYLVWADSNRVSLKPAVPIYLSFLRRRLHDLQAVTPGSAEVLAEVTKG